MKRWREGGVEMRSIEIKTQEQGCFWLLCSGEDRAGDTELNQAAGNA